jgi:hypothetical protein
MFLFTTNKFVTNSQLMVRLGGLGHFLRASPPVRPPEARSARAFVFTPSPAKGTERVRENDHTKARAERATGGSGGLVPQEEGHKKVERAGPCVSMHEAHGSLVSSVTHDAVTDRTSFYSNIIAPCSTQ